MCTAIAHRADTNMLLTTCPRMRQHPPPAPACPQDSKAPEPLHFCGASSGAGGNGAGSGGAGGRIPVKSRLLRSDMFPHPHNRRWHIFATQTREPESGSVPCSTCAVLGIFPILQS